MIAVGVATSASLLRAECVGLSMSNNKRFADLVSYAFPVDAVGTEYLVFAKRLMPEQRVGFSVGERQTAFGVPTCGGGTQPLERVRWELQELGRSRAPR